MAGFVGLAIIVPVTPDFTLRDMRSDILLYHQGISISHIPQARSNSTKAAAQAKSTSL